MEDLRKIATAVGIDTKGKSADQLRTLITEAATKKPPNVIDPNALSKHFEEGRFTDCTIRVKIGDAPADVDIGPPAKRLRSGSNEASGAEGAAVEEKDEEIIGHVINAHAVILASRSAYFERAMGGEWRESKDRSLEVEVSGEEEYVTFRRLIKLCYGTTFIKEGDRDLDVSELVQLILVANAFECMDAVKECATALTNGDLNWEGAVQCLELTDMLKGVEGMKDLAKKAVGVIAKKVGPVHKLFVPSDDEGKPGVLGGLKLSKKVKDLSHTVFETLLSSKGLQLQTANEAFWLLLSWVEAQSKKSEKGKQKLFTRMAKHLRFHAMDPGYILLMVSEHPRIIAAGIQHKVMRASLIYSNLARRTDDDVDWLYEQTANFPVPKEKFPWPCGKATWTLDGSFNATDVAAVKSGESRDKVVGLVAGLPWCVKVCRRAEEGQQAGVYTMCDLPFDWMTYGGGAGFFFHFTIEAALGTPRTKAFSFAGKRTWAESAAWGFKFGAWDDVFREGSEWLVDGELRVRVTATTINDQGPSKLAATA